MSEILRELIGRQVIVYSGTERGEGGDIGELVSYDNAWLCLRKGTELLYFSVFRIRLVKPV